MRYQLRIYTIKAGEMADWLEEWSRHVRPLREKLGFHVMSAWTIEDTNRFVWILRYDGLQPWEEAEAAYYRSRERTRLDPDPARHIETSEQWLMTAVSIACD